MAVYTVKAGLGAHFDLLLAAGATNRWRLGYIEPREPGDPRVPIDLTGWTARAQFRRSTSSDTAWATLATGGNGITVDADGWVTLTLAASATDGDDWAGRTGVWDVELTDPIGEVIRLGYGAFTMAAQVTR